MQDVSVSSSFPETLVMLGEKYTTMMRLEDD